MVGVMSLRCHSSGLAPEAAFLAVAWQAFSGVFQHGNIRTPTWLGYLIQRPEAHAVHLRARRPRVQLREPAAVGHRVRDVPQPGRVAGHRGLLPRRVGADACACCSDGISRGRRGRRGRQGSGAGAREPAAAPHAVRPLVPRPGIAPGLSHAWSAGGLLYRALGRIDAWHGAWSWTQGLDWLLEVSARWPIAEIQFWGHGRVRGGLWIDEERASPSPRSSRGHYLRDRLARLKTGSCRAARRCGGSAARDVFGTQRGRDLRARGRGSSAAAPRACTHQIGVLAERPPRARARRGAGVAARGGRGARAGARGRLEPAHAAHHHLPPQHAPGGGAVTRGGRTAPHRLRPRARLSPADRALRSADPQLGRRRACGRR